MVRADLELATLLRVQRWHIEGPEDSIYRVLSADAQLQQGLNPTFVIFDEVHVQPNRDLWDAMTLGMVRPGAMIVGITTAGFDRTTLAWDLYERGNRGDFYFWWREPADPDCNWQDPTVWAESNPALGDFLPLEVLAEDAKTTPESAYRRFHLNQWTTTHTAWLPHGAWRAIVRPDRVIDPKEPVILFLDGSWANDSTGIVGCTVNDPQLFTVGLWEPDPEFGHIDMGAVETALRGYADAHNVLEMAFDPRGFQDFFDRLERAGYPVAEWATNSLDRMVPACSAFFGSPRASRPGGTSPATSSSRPARPAAATTSSATAKRT